MAAAGATPVENEAVDGEGHEHGPADASSSGGGGGDSIRTNSLVLWQPAAAATAAATSRKFDTRLKLLRMDDTNLNAPPPNWLRSVPSFAGFSGVRHYTGFSSFRMAAAAGGFAAPDDDDCDFQAVDVVSDAENIKKLLKMPFSADTPVSMLVHRVGKALLIDELDLRRLLMNSGETEWSWLRVLFHEFVLKSMGNRRRNAVVPRRSTGEDAIRERNLISKFLYHSTDLRSPTSASLNGVGCGSNADAVEDHEVEDKEQQQQQEDHPSRWPPHLQLPEPKREDVHIPGPKLDYSKPHDFARTLLWNFEDIRMLIGSDMPIFGDDEHPSVSLRLHNMQKPINILTGLDYWLDNLMCQVPEVLMCFHIDGIVQKYEMIQTEDLPALSPNSKFSPSVIRDVAKNILSFLKNNATKEGHTYWLFKGRDDDIVKLYDLTSLNCSAKATAASGAAGGQKGSNRKGEDGQDQQRPSRATTTTTTNMANDNPFRTSVAMLLYKVARNMFKNRYDSQVHHRRRNRHRHHHKENNVDTRGQDVVEDDGVAVRLLRNCLSLLDKAKYSQISASSLFMLSDILVPDGVDPQQPNLHKIAVIPEDNNRRRRRHRLLDWNEENDDDDDDLGDDGEGDDDLRSGFQQVPKVDLDSLTKHFVLEKKQAQQQQQQKKKGDILMASSSEVTERCQNALAYVLEGLDLLRGAAVAGRGPSGNEDDDGVPRRDGPASSPGSSVPIPMPYDNPREHQVQLFSPPRPRGRGPDNRSGQAESRDQRLSRRLEALLLKKASVILAVLAEKLYVGEKFGASLRTIRLLFRCHHSALLDGGGGPEDDYDEDSSSGRPRGGGVASSCTAKLLSFSLGLAGDCYVNIKQSWNSLSETYGRQFATRGSDDDDNDDDDDDGQQRQLQDRLEALLPQEDDLSGYTPDLAILRFPRDAEEASYLAKACLTGALAKLEAAGGKQTSSGSKQGRGGKEQQGGANLDNDRRSLLARRGNVCNERGILFMNALSEPEEDLAEICQAMSGILDSCLDRLAEKLECPPTVGFGDGYAKGPMTKVPAKARALMWKIRTELHQSLSDFEELGDARNRALVLANIARLMRMEAHGLCQSEGPPEYEDGRGGVSKDDGGRENQLAVVAAAIFDRYSEAVKMYEAALKLLPRTSSSTAAAARSKKSSSKDVRNGGQQPDRLYASVQWQLQTCCMAYGEMLQMRTPVKLMNTDETVAAIAGVYLKALNNCDLTPSNPDQVEHQNRYATVHRKLGSMHLCRSDHVVEREGKTSKKAMNLRQIADNHYQKSCAVFREIEAVYDFLRSHVERVHLHGEAAFNTSERSCRKHFAVFLDVFSELDFSVPQLKEKLKMVPQFTHKVDTDSLMHKVFKQLDDDVAGYVFPEFEEMELPPRIPEPFKIRSILHVLINSLKANLKALNVMLLNSSASSNTVQTALDWAKSAYLISMKMDVLSARFMPDLELLINSIKDRPRYLK